MRNEYDKAMADTLKNRLSRWIKGVKVEFVNAISEGDGNVRLSKVQNANGARPYLNKKGQATNGALTNTRNAGSFPSSASATHAVLKSLDAISISNIPKAVKGVFNSIRSLTEASLKNAPSANLNTPVTAKNLISQLWGCGFVRENNGASVYLQENGVATTRASDHSASATFFREGNNLSIVIRKPKNFKKFESDKTKNVVEAVFKEDYLSKNPTLIPHILRDIGEFIATGEYHDTAGAMAYNFSGDDAYQAKARDILYLDAVNRGDMETAISLNEADKTAMDAEITAKADAAKKKSAEAKAKAEAKLAEIKAKREGKTAPKAETPKAPDPKEAAYQEWLNKAKFSDTPARRAEWERKQELKDAGKKTAHVAEKAPEKADLAAQRAEKPARFEQNSQNSAKAPSVKMKDEAAEKRAQKLEDELGALFMSEELSKAVDNDIMSALSDNPTIEDVKKVIKDFINGKLSNKRFSTEDISRYIKQGGSDAERVVEAAILAERLGSRIQESSQIFQRGISRIFSQSSFGWKENIISSLEGLFGDIERFNGEPIDGKDTHAVWHVGNDAYKLVRLWDGYELEGLTKQIMLNARFEERYSGDVLGGGTVDGKLYILVKQPWIEQGVSDREIVKRAINGLKKQNGVERAPDEDGYINEYSFSLNLQDDRYIYSDLNLNQNYFVTEYGEIRIIDADVTDKDIGKVVFMSEEFDLAKTQRRINNLLELVSELTDEFGTFNDVAKYFAVNYPEKFGAMKPYLRTLWNVVADQLNLPEVSKDEVAQIYADIERDGVEEKVEPKEPPANKLQSTRISDAADEIVALIEKGDKFSRKDITDIVERQLGGKVASGDFDAKQVTDILELAVNRYMQNKGTIFSPASNVGSDNAVAVINRIRHLLGIIPTHTTRSVEQDALQQFSTPPHEAFVAAWTANIKEDDVMLEPSAGIGGLAVFADIAGAKVVLNEYSPRRAEILEQLGLGKPYDHDAQYLYALLEPEVKSGKIKRPTVVVMNPPFSNSVSSGRKNTHIGAEHVEQALKLLAPGGRLVAIVGNGMAHDKPAFKDWWNRIGKEYTVRANIGISG